MMSRQIAAGFVVLAAATVGAQDLGRLGGPGGPGPGAGFALFQALDTNHDNALSAAEINAAPSVLRQLDRNGDGRVTADELPAALGRGGPGGRGPGLQGRGRGSGIGNEPEAEPPSADEVAAMLMAFDKNGDGKLTKDEVPERLQGLFTRADVNKDGVLSADEIKTAAASEVQLNATAGDNRGTEGERGRGPAGRPGGPGRPDPLLAALDLNGDGVLSSEEIAASSTSLRKMDTNGDGALSFDEIFPGGPGRGRL